MRMSRMRLILRWHGEKDLLSGNIDEPYIDEALLQQINWVKNKYSKTK